MSPTENAVLLNAFLFSRASPRLQNLNLSIHFVQGCCVMVGGYHHFPDDTFAFLARNNISDTSKLEKQRMIYKC